MDNSKAIELNTKGLDNFMRALKGKLPTTKVGILGKDNARTGESTNATIGAKHEFGLDGLPIRSFLRMPLSMNLDKYLAKSKAFDERTLKRVIQEATIMEWMKLVGIVSEEIIADAFATGGFGKWKPSNMKHKKVQQTLVETQQLRNSISSEVK